MDGKYLGVFKDARGGEAVINPDHVTRLTASTAGKVTVHLSTGELVQVPGGLEDVAQKLCWALHDNEGVTDAPADTFLAEHGMA